LTLDAASATLTIHAAPGKPTSLYAVWKRFDSGWRFFVQPAAQAEIDLKPDAKLGATHQVVLSAVDRVGNESPRVAFIVAPIAK
ncbi:MAG: hypothetical protein WCH44_17055, partial [Betaproteobacteria bacterium]